MDISIKGKNLDVGDALRTYVEKHLDAVVIKYFSKAHDAAVTISREAHRFRCDIVVHPVRGVLVQSHAASEDAYASFDASLERIAKQIRRYKRRITNHHNRRAPSDSIPAQQYVLAPESEHEELSADAQPAIIAELHSEIATLTVGEAVMRMDLADLPAIMFRNRASGGRSFILPVRFARRRRAGLDAARRGRGHGIFARTMIENRFEKVE